MTVFVRRLAKLERCFPPIVLPDLCRQSQVKALLELSPAELQTLETMLVRGTSGNSLSAEEQAAMDRYQEAFVATQHNAPQFGKEYA